MSTQNTKTPAVTPQKDLVLSRNPEKAVQEMIEVIRVLSAIYTEETAALLAGQTRVFIAMQERKNQAIRNYQAGAQQIIARKDALKGVSPALRQKLAAMEREFSTLTAGNLQALDRLRMSVQRLGNRIMQAARNAVQKQSVNYSKSGSLNKMDRPVSLGVNRSA